MGLKMYSSAGAAVTKCHKQGSLEQQDFIISQSGGQKSTIKVSAGLVPPEGVRKSLFQSSLPASGSLGRSLARGWMSACLPDVLPVSSPRPPSVCVEPKFPPFKGHYLFF